MTISYGEHPDGMYGEVMLEVEPNREFGGKILAYGQYLEVVQPQSLKKKIKDILKKQLEQY